VVGNAKALKVPVAELLELIRGRPTTTCIVIAGFGTEGHPAEEK
jgi:hypothetical protein